MDERESGEESDWERVVELAMRLGWKHLADYGSARSRHDFTQHQLMACLILRAYLKTTYRGVLELLSVSPNLREALGMQGKLPHYTSLQKFSARSRVLAIACDDPDDWTGGVFEDYGGPAWQWYYNLADDALAREAFKIGEWNTFRIEAIGKSIKVWVNGVPTINMIHDKYASCYIALKIHALGDKPEQEKIFGHFRNIRVITNNPAAYSQAMSLPAKTVP